jgi:hypothetical protein
MPQVLDKALSIHGHIDILINNAGFSILGAIEDISDAETRAQFETNFFAPLAITRHLLPSMRRRRSGTIVNISSTAGQVALPAVGIYAASKHALEAVSEALSHEVAPLGIRVLIIQPGGFNTGFAAAVKGPEVGVTRDYSEGPVGAVLGGLAGLAGNQFGDVGKGCRAIFDVVTKTGLWEKLEGSGNGDGEGKGVEYLRIPLGTDCAARLKGQFDGFQRGLEGTRLLWESTDLEGKGERKMLNFSQRVEGQLL